MTKIKNQSKLTLFDVTNLVVGAIVGADIYVASSFGAGYLGPASLLVWVVAGVVAIVIALAFAQCAALVPKVGGSYAYAKEAWGPFPGFIVGWSLWLAEWVSLAVFPVAFVRYLMFFFPDLSLTYQIIIKALFVTVLATSNIIGSKSAGRTNDVLTLVKLSPLILFSVIGLIFMVLHPVATMSNFAPFSPFGYSNFGLALVLIFWAYAGFEISTLPADEIENPGRTIPRAIVLGISIVTIFYMVTNTVLFGVRPSIQLASDTAPLASATAFVLSFNPTWLLIGGTFVGIGALISVAGSDESGMIGTTSLGYALAVDGLFPRAFTKIHRRFKTPYLIILFQSTTALIASLLGSLSLLVATSVFLLGVAYLATSASVFSLRRKHRRPSFRIRGGRVIPVLGVIFSLYIISQCSVSQILLGLALIVVGIPIFAKYAPKKELRELKAELLSPRAFMERARRQEKRFLAHLLAHVKHLYRRIAGKKPSQVQLELRRED
ncbi:MAG: APC family permease [Promethearchaeati archaeon SRVP18_Atabeyarchaeia-1]